MAIIHKYPTFTVNAVYEMAGKDICSLCAFETKYICIKCKVYCCTRCSEPEYDEETPGWKAGKSVGYCEDCSLRILDEDSDQFHQGETKSKHESCPRKHQKEIKIKRY